MFGWIRNTLGKLAGRSKSARVKGTYDAAVTTKENQNHWANADSLSADALNDPATRQVLRDRARYECRNNSYAGGLVESLANDLIGTGPRLQLSIPGVDREITRAVESAYANWARAANFAEDLRILHSTKVRDGEGFALLTTNPALPASGLTPVTLDLGLYEAEQIADPWYTGWDPLYLDGIRRDKQGNPVEYSFLEAHPGGLNAWRALKPTPFPAASVCHWYKPDRPGQGRGVTTLVAGLPLFSQLRRYTLATLGAAELAAMLSGVMKTDTSPEDGGSVTVEAMDTVEMARNSLLTLPAGWDATQFKPEQPVGNYPDFKRELLNEVGRGCQAPLNVITGNSSNYNFSSAKLDERMYFRMIKVERSRMRHRVLDPVFLAWLREAALCGALPAILCREFNGQTQLVPPVSTWAWEWHFDGFASIDPQKDAQTDELELRTGTTTLAEICARKGLDWEEVLRQRAREEALRKELGLAASVAVNQPQPAPQPQPQDQEATNGAPA
jgi:lambda family phage portal protein